VVGVGGYRYFVAAAQAQQALTDVPVVSLPHAPAWIAGLALVGQRAVGVLDLGRFLGVARALPGPWLQPDEHLNCAWVLRVHRLEAVEVSVSVQPWLQAADDVTDPSDGGSAWSGIASRRRPPFCSALACWSDEGGQACQADVLDLRALLRHPRVVDFQS